MLKILVGSKILKQVSALFITQIFGLLVGFILNIFLARQMGSDNFGIFSLSIAIINFIAVFFGFGYFYSLSRFLAIKSSTILRREFIGVGLVLIIINSILFFILIFVFSFFVDVFYEYAIGNIIRISSIVSWGLIIPFFFELILKGCNFIYFISFFNILNKLFFLLVICILYLIDNLTPTLVVFSFLMSYIFSFALCVCGLKPTFKKTKYILKILHKETILYGLNLYVCRIITTPVFYLDKLLIAFFLSSRDVGIYSLAGSFSNPIAILAIALNSVLFKAIANSNTISKKFLLINFVCVVLSFIAINILSIVVINIFLNIPDYDGIYRFIFLISLSTVVTALYQPYNNWFVARGYGAELKKMNFIIIPIFLVANVILILFFGIFGAIFASISVNIIYFILYTIYYRVILKNIDRDNKINYNIV